MKISKEMRKYLAEIGGRGGRKMTPKKREHLKRISKLPRPGGRRRK